MSAYYAAARDDDPPSGQYPAVYALYDEDRLVYVGRSSNFPERLAAHRLRIPFSHWRVFPADDDAAAAWLEGFLITMAEPSLNVDDFAPSYGSGAWL